MTDPKFQHLIDLMLSFSWLPEELRSYYQTNREILSEGSNNILVLVPFGSGTSDDFLQNISRAGLIPDNIFILFYPSQPMHFKMLDRGLPGMIDEIWNIIPETIKDYGIDVNFPFLIESFLGVDNSGSAKILICKDLSDREFLWGEVTSENVKSMLNNIPSKLLISDPSVTIQQIQDEINRYSEGKIYRNLLPWSIYNTVSSILTAVKNPENFNESVGYLFKRRDSFENVAAGEDIAGMVGAVIPSVGKNLNSWIAGLIPNEFIKNAISKNWGLLIPFLESLKEQLNQRVDGERLHRCLVPVFKNSYTREKLESQSESYLLTAEILERDHLSDYSEVSNVAIITSIASNYCKIFEYELSCSIDHLIRRKLSIELPEYYYKYQNGKKAFFYSQDRTNFEIDYNKKNRAFYFKDKDWFPVSTGASLVVISEMINRGEFDELKDFFTSEQLDVLKEVGEEIKNIRNVCAHSIIDLEQLSRVKNGLTELESKGVFEGMFKIKALLKA